MTDHAEGRPASVSIWFAAVGTGIELAASTLSRLEIDRAARFVHEPDRRRYLTAAVLLRAVVSRETGAPAADVTIDRGCDRCGRDHGRPRVEGQRPALGVSVSHAGEMVAVAYAWGAEVGIDLEPDARASEVDPRSVLAPSESDQASFHDLVRVSGPTSALLATWVQKEAALKAVGVGLRVPPRSVRIRSVSTQRMVEVPDERGVRLSVYVSTVPVDFGYHVAIATVGRPPVAAVRDGSDLLEGRGREAAKQRPGM